MLYQLGLTPLIGDRRDTVSPLLKKNTKACVSYRSSAYFRSARKRYINIEITKNFVSKFKAQFEKKLLNKARITCFEKSTYFIENDLCIQISL